MDVTQRRVLFLILALVLILAMMTAPALAAPPTTYATSQGFTATLNAADTGSYQISLMGNSLDFTTYALNQSVPSQNALSIYNMGARAFDVYVSADSAPSYMGMYWLGFSDYPGQDQVRWTLTQWPNMGMDTSVNEMYATNFGTLYSYNAMTLYSNLLMGSGLSYPAWYSWTGTVYAVPTP
jgi:hypothetical protein